MPRLTDWAVVMGGDPYTPPECQSQHLHGAVAGHASFVDGDVIKTSRILGQRGGKVVTVSGSEYELGAVANAYEAFAPNARQRLFQSLPQL